LDTNDFLNMQRSLQISMKEANPTQGGDPYLMDLEELIEFIRWNHTALVVGWKPWATSRHIHMPNALHEMVDAWHFFLNMMLGFGAMAGWTPQDLGDEFTQYYIAKNRKNLERQQEGYDGVSTKCLVCNRELSETECTDEFCAYTDGVN
jgi:hypothetical protein